MRQVVLLYLHLYSWRENYIDENLTQIIWVVDSSLARSSEHKEVGKH